METAERKYNCPKTINIIFLKTESLKNFKKCKTGPYSLCAKAWRLSYTFLPFSYKTVLGAMFLGGNPCNIWKFGKKFEKTFIRTLSNYFLCAKGLQGRGNVFMKINVRKNGFLYKNSIRPKKKFQNLVCVIS